MTPLLVNFDPLLELVYSWPLYEVIFDYLFLSVFDLKVKYHIKNEQTNIQIDGRYVTNSNSKLLIIFKACRMGTKFKISTVLCVVGMKY